MKRVLKTIPLAMVVVWGVSGCSTTRQHVKSSAEQRADCMKGDAQACVILGERARAGHQGQKVDVGQARDFLKRACEAGSARGCAILGDWYNRNEWGLRKRGEAPELLDKGCQGREPVACLRLGERYYFGDDVTQDRVRAQQLMAQARSAAIARCEAGDGEACDLMVGMSLWGFGARADRGETQRFTLQACALGQMGRCLALAQMNYDVEAAAKKGRVIAQRACDDGRAEACFELGRAVQWGADGAQDLVAARGLFERGCRQGSAGACDALAEFFRLKLGGEASVEQREGAEASLQAVLEAACEQGHGRSCDELGDWLSQREEASAHLRARAAYLKACKQGWDFSCNRLARLWEKGIGGDADASKKAVFEDLERRHDAVRCRAGNSRVCQWLSLELGVNKVLSELEEMEREASGEAGGTELEQGAEVLEPSAIKALAFAMDQDACEERGVLSSCVSFAFDLKDTEQERAAAILSQTCDRGYVIACTSLYEMSEDEAVKRASAEKACELNYTLGCRQLIELKPDEADVLTEKLCRQGDLKRCRELGAERLIEQATLNCHRGMYSVCHEVAKAYEEHQPEGWEERATRFDWLGCEGLNDERACARFEPESAQENDGEPPLKGSADEPPSQEKEPEAPPCGPLRFDLVSGQLNGLSPDASQEQVKAALPCFTGDTRDGSKYNYGGGVFYLKHDFFYYTGRDFIEVRGAFKGQVEPALLGMPIDAAIGQFGPGESIKGVPDATLFSTSYGCLRLHVSDKVVTKAAAHMQSCADLKAWYHN